MIKRTILTLSIASVMMMSFTACEQTQRENPLLVESELPFGAPDFSKIQVTDYMPAFLKAMEQKREAIKQITENEDSATFENTILAYENSGRLLDRVSRVFFALTEADKTDEIGEIEKTVQPLLTDLENEISFNKPLFERIKKVYDTQYESLQGEDKKLLEEIYKDFVRKGALLSDDKMARMKEINLRISELQQQWGDSLQAATNDALVWVEKEEELAGLSEADIAQCKKDAESLPVSTIASCAKRCSRLLSIVLTVQANTILSPLSARLPSCVPRRLRSWVILTTPPIHWRIRWPRPQ